MSITKKKPKDNKENWNLWTGQMDRYLRDVQQGGKQAK